MMYTTSVGPLYCVMQPLSGAYESRRQDETRSSTQQPLLSKNTLGPVNHYFDRTCISPCLTEPTLEGQGICRFSLIYGIASGLGLGISIPIYLGQPLCCSGFLTGAALCAGTVCLGENVPNCVVNVKNMSPYTTYQMDRPINTSLSDLNESEFLRPRIPERSVAITNGVPDMSYQMDRFADMDSSDKVRTELLRARISG